MNYADYCMMLVMFSNDPFVWKHWFEATRISVYIIYYFSVSGLQHICCSALFDSSEMFLKQNILLATF